jgi:NAD(P)-dependent dehydrogenase (short-subunit alcohol dehydrogenase family)
MELKGSVAVVTGSARGIGRAIAEALAARGARVGLADVLAEPLAKTAADLTRAGAKVLPVVTDTTSPPQVEAMVAQVESGLGPIDILINNAGTFSYIGPLWEAEPDRWFRDIRVNIYGSFLCCRAVVRSMVRRQRGYVINVASSGGVGDPHPYSTSYATSKTGLVRMTEGLAKEAEGFGVKVFVIGPPAVHTDMTQFIVDDPGGKKFRPDFAKWVETGKAYQPADVVTKLVLNLVSGRADRLTGRFFLCNEDFDEMVSRTDAILKDDLKTLRLR